MGWLQEKYTREYFLQKTADGNPLPYGVYGVDYWERGEMYPEGRRILDQLLIANSSVLDIGCGRGDAMRYLLERGARKVVGLDFSPHAIEISRKTLADFHASRYEFVESDILTYLGNSDPDQKFSHILMLDVIEHILRSEVDLILPRLLNRLISGGVLVVHTPFFTKDEDVFLSGGKLDNRDSSDKFEETRGMHINRYSYESIQTQVEKYGFKRWSDYIFVKPPNGFPIWNYHGFGRNLLGRIVGYSIR